MASVQEVIVRDSVNCGDGFRSPALTPEKMTVTIDKMYNIIVHRQRRVEVYQYFDVQK